MNYEEFHISMNPFVSQKYPSMEMQMELDLIIQYKTLTYWNNLRNTTFTNDIERPKLTDRWSLRINQSSIN